MILAAQRTAWQSAENPLALSLSKGPMWFDTLTTSGTQAFFCTLLDLELHERGLGE